MSRADERAGQLRLHRMRQQLVKFRTMQINSLGGLLTEYGQRPDIKPHVVPVTSDQSKLLRKREVFTYMQIGKGQMQGRGIGYTHAQQFYSLATQAALLISPFVRISALPRQNRFVSASPVETGGSSAISSNHQIYVQEPWNAPSISRLDN